MKKRLVILFVVSFLLTQLGWHGVLAQSPIMTPTPEATVMPDPGGDLPPVALSGSWIAAFLAAALSVWMAYIPGAQAWWRGFAYKREAFLVAGVVVDVALVLLHFAGAFDLGLGTAFTFDTLNQAINAFLSFLGAAQGAFMVQRWFDQAK